MTTAVRGSDWSAREVEVCVSSYFEHLQLELTGNSFNKAQLYRDLSQLTGRTPKSIELKFRNISAVLDAMSREWMGGLAPFANYQELLAEHVSLHITSLDALPVIPGHRVVQDGMAEGPSFYLEPPPVLLQREKALPEFIERLVRKFDPVARDANNRDVGHAGEEFVLRQEKRFLNLVGRSDLAANVRWVSQLDGDGAGYDILSFTDRGDRKYVEVKTTVGNSRTPFFLSRNEFSFSKQNDSAYRLVRLFDFRKGVRGFELEGDIEKHAQLSTETYRADFTRT